MLLGRLSGLSYLLRFLACYLACTGVACAPFSFDSTVDSALLKTDRSNPLPPVRVSAESLIVDTAFLPLHSAEEEQDLWRSVDESLVEVAIRERWQANGLRVGRLLGTAINHLKSLDKTESGSTLLPIDALEKAGLASELSHVSRRIHCRPQQPYRLPTNAPKQGARVLLLAADDRLVGQTLDSAECYFEFFVQSRLNQRSIVTLQPVIEHGQRRQTWIGQDQSLRLENKREQLALQHLKTELELSSGDILLVGTTTPAVGLGQFLLEGKRADGQQERTVLLLRVLGTKAIALPTTVSQ